MIAVSHLQFAFQPLDTVRRLTTDVVLLEAFDQFRCGPVALHLL